MNKTLAFNVVAFILAVALPVLAGLGYTGEVPEGWAALVGPAIALINWLLKKLSQTEVGQAYNV